MLGQRPVYRRRPLAGKVASSTHALTLLSNQPELILKNLVQPEPESKPSAGHHQGYVRTHLARSRQRVYSLKAWEETSDELLTTRHPADIKGAFADLQSNFSMKRLWVLCAEIYRALARFEEAFIRANCEQSGVR